MVFDAGGTDDNSGWRADFSPGGREGGKVGGIIADSGAALVQQYVTSTPHVYNRHIRFAQG